MFDNKELLKTSILQSWDGIKTSEKNGISCEALKKQLKETEDTYRYHYEGGSRPAHYPSTSNKTWMYCQSCDYERQLGDNESEDGIARGCPNNCNKGHFFATERRPRDKSNSWLDNYKGNNREREREREQKWF